MNRIPQLLKETLAVCEGKVPAEDLQFWSEWLTRGCALFEQAQSDQLEPLAVNFATAAAEPAATPTPEPKP